MIELKETLLGFLLSIFIVLIGLVIGSYLLPIAVSDYTNSDTMNYGTGETVSTVDYDGELTLDEAQEGVVTIYGKQAGNDDISSQGSGFLYADNYIMTNEHVVAGHSEFFVQYQNGDWVNVSMVGSDMHTDIAILEPDYVPDSVPVLPLQTSEPVVGEPTFAIGAPSGLDTTVTEGVVSAKNLSMHIETAYPIPDTIQTDSALNPGNSGGPLVSTTEGTKVIGVNRATQGENIGLAVSAKMAHNVGKSIIETGSPEHAHLGIVTSDDHSYIADDNGRDYGVLIDGIEEGSPFENQTLFTEDRISESDYFIIKIDNKDIRTSEQLYSYLMSEKEPGDIVDLYIYNDGEVTERSIQLKNRALL